MVRCVSASLCVCVYVCACLSQRQVYICISVSGSVENDTVTPIGASARTLTRLTILTDYIKLGVC